LKRGEKYLAAGADGVYVEGPESVEQLRDIGKAFKGQPLATSVLENGGKTPWLSPEEFAAMGFAMVLYPTTILFRATKAIQLAAANLRRGQPLDKSASVDMAEFEKVIDLAYWQKIEKEFPVTEK
jgi:2-methylisocitrate lyase-like PEP mutase family enzyme